MSRVGIIGAGRFGLALARLIADGGHHTVRTFDPHREPPPELREPSLAALAGAADVVILAVPVAAIAEVLQDLRPHLRGSHWVMDVASVKLGPAGDMERILGAQVPWVATHPLFGPASLARGERPLVAVVCPNAQHPDAVSRARALYEGVGCDVVEADADAHDRIMARTHALAFFVAKAMLRVEDGTPPPFSPPSFQAMARTIETVRSDAGHLFFTIQHENTHAAGERRRLIEALQDIDRELARAPRTDPGEHGRALAILPAGPDAPQALPELVDEIDRELVELLARRVRLTGRSDDLEAVVRAALDAVLERG